MSNIHKDCFGYGDNGCTILKELFCKNENCKFYKTDRDGKYPNPLSDKEESHTKIRGAAK